MALSFVREFEQMTGIDTNSLLGLGPSDILAAFTEIPQIDEPL
jgi:hypothetical protein